MRDIIDLLYFDTYKLVYDYFFIKFVIRTLTNKN